MSDNEGGDDGQLAAEVAPPAPGKSKLVPLLLLVNTALMGFVLFMVLKKPAAPAAGGHGDKAAEHGEEKKGEGHGDEKKEEGHGDEKKEGEGHGAEGGGAGSIGPTLKLAPFVIQLRSNGDSERYIRAELDLELDKETDKEFIEKRMPRVRDEVIGFFSDRSLDEVRGSEGLKRIKEMLLRRFEEIIPGRRVRAIFISDLVVQ